MTTKKTVRLSKAKLKELLQSNLQKRVGKHNGATTDKKRKAVNLAITKISLALGIELDYSKLDWMIPFHPLVASLPSPIKRGGKDKKK